MSRPLTRRALFKLGAAPPASDREPRRTAAPCAALSPELARRLAPAARELVAVAGVGPGMRVLDVGGDVALAAAAAGADVTAIRVAGVERTPFDDGEFDAVLSSFGAIFWPRPRAAVAELARVGRRGAPIALTAFAPAGSMGRLIDAAARVPAGAPRPSRWGRYESAFLWLGSAVEGFELTARELELRFASAAAARRCLGPPGPELDALLAGPADGGEVKVGIGYAIVRGHITSLVA